MTQGLIIPIVYGAFVSVVHIKVLSSEDAHVTIGWEPYPGDIGSLAVNLDIPDGITKSAMSATLTTGLSDEEPYLWTTKQDSLNLTSLRANIHTADQDITVEELSRIGQRVFTPAYPIGTNTGLHRGIALRLNSSISCASTPQSAFPSSCHGGPLNATFSNFNSSSSNITDPFGDIETPRFRARLCAPGCNFQPPWRNTFSRQDIIEEFWLDFQRTGQTLEQGIDDEFGPNFTQHCTGKSTMGYFEMPNYWNGYVAGDILDTDLPKDPVRSVQGPIAPDSDETFDKDLYLPGPFLIGILAVFGNGTFFNAVASHSNVTDHDSILCKQFSEPFARLAEPDTKPEPYSSGIHTLWNKSSYPIVYCHPNLRTDFPPLLQALFQWLPNFADPIKATSALTLATWAANYAILNPQDNKVASNPLIRALGSDHQKPTMPVPVMIVISLLLAIHLLCLAALAIYASMQPTWTEQLDSFAMLRVGAEIAGELPPMSAVDVSEVQLLDKKAGWVGDAGAEWDEQGVEVRELVLGGAQEVRPSGLYRCRNRKMDEKAEGLEDV